jgi:hypothetical protein
MAKFKKGDKVKIRPDANSQFRGRIAIIQKEPDRYSNAYGYVVKIDAQGFAPTCQISENDLEAVTGK